MGTFLDRFCPDLCVKNISDIDLDGLKASGYEALMIDLDNTLLPWKDSCAPASSREWVERAKALGMKICIVSNTHYPSRMMKIAAELDVPALAGALKPRSHGFSKAAKMLGCENAHVVVVGDQVMTDVLGGNRAGMYTILVEPMHPREFAGTKVSRVIERIILFRLRRLGKLGNKV
ncbi:MAG: YqeG family HAD IIIA-type phosphatase [Armatimonadetes bacterium]|nr:YqeG family HAD IIIA-type phosphatase [Armatimonadota bacterium]